MLILNAPMLLVTLLASDTRGTSSRLVPDGSPAGIPTSAAGLRDTCEVLPAETSDSAVAIRLITRHFGPGWINAAPGGASRMSYGRLSLAGHPRGFLSVLVAWPPWLDPLRLPPTPTPVVLDHFSTVGLVANGCLTYGGDRLSGPGAPFLTDEVLQHLELLQRWNDAIETTYRSDSDSLARDPLVAMDLAVLFFDFATGSLIDFPRDLPTTPAPAVVNGGSAGFRLSRATSTAVYDRTGTWEVTGRIPRGVGEMEFVAHVTRRGTLVDFVVR